MTTTTETPQLQLLTLDPTTIRTPDQIRQDATPDEGLIQSVAANGVLQPPTVVWEDDEQAYYVVFGARRVGAAIIAGLSEIPVIVRDPETITAARMLEEQIVENERRDGITPTDLARGYARLEQLFGESIEDIAARTGEKPERITAGIRAARSEKTTALLASRPTLDLEKAAILTEFDAHPSVQRELAETAVDKPQDFDWRVRSARARIAKETRTAELKAEIRAAKIKLAKTDGYGGFRSGTHQIDDLVDAKGKKLTPKNHASCPGHRAYIKGFAADDMKIAYACEGYKEHGHTWASPSSAPRELTEDEKRANLEREERAAALSANRAARRQWIRDLLPGKINQLPGVYEYMAAALLHHNSSYLDHRQPTHTLQLINIDLPENPGYGVATAALDDAIATKTIAPFRLMLATSLGLHEQMVENGRAAAVIRHMEQLKRWGYQLSEIDEAALAASREKLAPEETTVEDAEAEE